jgi:hypothetical protein
MKSEPPTIAFDRFIRLEWISEALKVRAGQIDQSQLEEFLDNAGLGREARIKTRTKLKVLCLEPRGELKEFMDRGIIFAQSPSSVEKQLIFAWGAVVANYPFFAKVAELVGRLSSIQGDCAGSEIHRRMSEQYGERHNVKVATRAVIQTLVDWSVVRRQKDENRLIPIDKRTLSTAEPSLWLVESIVRATNKPVSLESINSNPLVFPFSFDLPLAYLVANSDTLELRMEGANQQIVDLRRNN